MCSESPSSPVRSTHSSRKIVDALGQYDAFDDTLILVGGIIPDEDRADLFVEGVDEIFGPGVSLERIIEYVRDNVPER